MIWNSEQSVKKREAEMDPDQAQELKNNKVAHGLDMMDKVLQMTEIKSVKRVASAWKYVVRSRTFDIIAIPERPLRRLHVLRFWGAYGRQHTADYQQSNELNIY
jgi:hypothetical protein